jgi:hypothetical protein
MKKLVALLLCLMMVVPATLASAETAEGKVLNIWCWNDEFQSRFNAYYPEVKEIAEDKSTTTLNDGTIVKWTINPNEGNNYQNKLDEALRAQESAAADDKIDIFLIEADYALKYVDSPYTLDVKADIGLTDENLAGQYKYTQEIATSADGKLKAVTWQATPGLFAYRRSIAKDVLGTDDPDAVQEALSDWDKFNAVAEQAAAKGYYMLSGYDDAYRTFSNNVSAPWVADDGETVVVDANLMKWVDQTKTKRTTTTSPPCGMRLGRLIRARPARSSASSTPLGASTSPCWATLWKLPSPTAARKKSATALMATTRSARARRLTTGAALGFARLPAPTTWRPSRTLCRS